MLIQLYLLKTLSGLHCGVGQGAGDIDLPTARDAVTGHPYAPGSSLKGVLRDCFAARPEAGVNNAGFEAVFGPDSQSADGDRNRTIDFASCVSFGDARLLCLPVRSFHGTFAYLTSPIALRLFRGDLRRVGDEKLGRLPVPEIGRKFENEILLTAANSPLAISRPLVVGAARSSVAVLLEELDLIVNPDVAATSDAEAWAEGIAGLFPEMNGPLDKELFKSRFAIVGDAVFDFLCETALPVVTRNAINDVGVAADGALWTEEFIPPEAILAGLLHATDSRRQGCNLKADEALDFLARSPTEFQLGGKATTGRGLVSLTLVTDAFPAR